MNNWVGGRLAPAEKPSPAGEGGSRRLTDEEFLSAFVFLKICLPKLKFFAVPFRSRAEPAKRSKLRAGRRGGTAGRMSAVPSPSHKKLKILS